MQLFKASTDDRDAKIIAYYYCTWNHGLSQCTRDVTPMLTYGFQLTST